jgi:hypothetical protein
MGPFAKIRMAGEALSSKTATELASAKRINTLIDHEQSERSLCAPTKSLHSQVNALTRESNERAALRREILALLTTATEEYDALPEEFITRLNKVVYSIDEADARNSDLIGVNKERALQMRRTDCIGYESSDRLFNPLNTGIPNRIEPMPIHPVDTQSKPIALGSLRAKLGEIPITTLLRLKNTTAEPLRIKTGLKLREGKYVSAITASDPNNQAVSYQLYPPSEIPPRTEVVIACRSRGGWWATSGIEGEITYTNRDESWIFSIKLHSPLIGHERTCKVKAVNTSDLGTQEEGLLDVKECNNSQMYWQISKDELDVKANNEVIVTISCQGRDISDSSLLHRHKEEVSPITDYSTDTSVECVYTKETSKVLLPL